MSRVNEREISPILDAAEKWKIRCLENGGSVLGEKNIWTNDCFEQLNKYFVENIDEGEGSFIEKLGHQLNNANPESKQLAAEILWALYLFPSNFGAASKRKTVLTVWEFSGEKLPPTHWALKDEVLGGIGSGSMSFTVDLWREFRGAILTLHDLVRLERNERKALLADPWKMAEWMDVNKATKNRPFRHTMLYLLFPDSFERICSSDHKKKIVSTYSQIFNIIANIDNRLLVDKTLLEIRKRIETENPDTRIDFYFKPWAEQWENKKPKLELKSLKPPPEITEEDQTIKSEFLTSNINAISLIYYGPPGTGKTYKLRKLFAEYGAMTS